MKLEFQTLSGQSFPLEVSGGDLIGDVKLQLLEKRGIPPHKQCIIYMGKELDDERPVSSYTLRSNPTFLLCLRGSDEATQAVGAQKLPRAPFLRRAFGSFADVKGWCKEKVNCFGQKGDDTCTVCSSDEAIHSEHLDVEML